MCSVCDIWNDCQPLCSEISNDWKKEFERQRDIIHSHFEDHRLMTDDEEDKAFQNLINHCNACDDPEKVRCLKEMLLDLDWGKT